MEITFFKTQDAFHRWLSKNHGKAPELIVGFYKKDSGIKSITYPEALDEALCFGWIDGIRRNVDETSYCIRFTPRRKNSIWSNVNIAKVEVLKKAGKMAPAGLKVYEERNPEKSGIYSFENHPATLPPAYEKKLKANKKAWAFFSKQAPWYQRSAIFWVVSAKREETQKSRLETLLNDSANGKRIGPLTNNKK